MSKVISLEEFKQMKANGEPVEDLLDIAIEAMMRGDGRYLYEMEEAVNALNKAIKDNLVKFNTEESILDGKPEEILRSCLDVIIEEAKEGKKND
jgi:hypothetical protein